MVSNTRCRVPGCKSTRKKHSEIFSFHRFPDNETLKQKWCEALNISIDQAKSNRVCSKHFVPDDYRPAMRPILKPNAVPSQHLTLISQKLLVHKQKQAEQREKCLQSFRKIKSSTSRPKATPPSKYPRTPMKKEVGTQTNDDFSTELTIEKIYQGTKVSMENDDDYPTRFTSEESDQDFPVKTAVDDDFSTQFLSEESDQGFQVKAESSDDISIQFQSEENDQDFHVLTESDHFENEHCQVESYGFSIEEFFKDDYSLNALTGLQSLKLLDVICGLHNHCKTYKKPQRMSVRQCVLMTFMKLKFNLPNTPLGVLFGNMSRVTIRRRFEETVEILAKIFRIIIRLRSSSNFKQKISIAFESDESAYSVNESSEYCKKHLRVISDILHDKRLYEKLKS